MNKDTDAFQNDDEEEFDPKKWEELFKMDDYAGKSSDHPDGVGFTESLENAMVNKDPIKEWTYDQHAQAAYDVIKKLFENPMLHLTMQKLHTLANSQSQDRMDVKLEFQDRMVIAYLIKMASHMKILDEMDNEKNQR